MKKLLTHSITTKKFLLLIKGGILMQKEIYETPEFEVDKFNFVDFISTSNFENGGGNDAELGTTTSPASGQSLLG